MSKLIENRNKLKTYQTPDRPSVICAIRGNFYKKDNSVKMVGICFSTMSERQRKSFSKCEFVTAYGYFHEDKSDFLTPFSVDGSCFLLGQEQAKRRDNSKDYINYIKKVRYE